MKTRILSEQNLNLVLNENTRLKTSQFEAIKNKMRELGNEELKQFAELNNLVVRYLAQSILFERRNVIKLPLTILKGKRTFYPTLRTNYCHTSFELGGSYTLISISFDPYIVLTTLDQAIGCKSLGEIKNKFPRHTIKAIVTT
jgi:hypothetical protein